MAFQEGDRVRIQTPDLGAGAELSGVYPHMQGLTGKIANIYNNDEIAVEIDLGQLKGVAQDVHAISTQRMRDKLDKNLPQEDRKLLTKEEIQFTPHYVLLVRAKDLQKV